jgi:hypothetical protein
MQPENCEEKATRYLFSSVSVPFVASRLAQSVADDPNLGE